MCFELDSVPPIPAIRGAAVSHEDLVLEAADGNSLAAFAATPDEPGDVGVVILPDVRGLYRFYEELALRFAERGIAAVAFDYFGRTAGAAKRFPSAASSTTSSCETAAPEIAGIGGSESSSKHMRAEPYGRRQRCRAVPHLDG